MSRVIWLNLMIFSLGTMLVSCEDLIDVNLNDADPRIVIEADLDNLDNVQVIYVSRTVPFNDVRKNEVVKDAFVSVEGRNGAVYDFQFSEELEGYVHRSFSVGRNIRYNLRVTVDDELFEATESLPEYVEVDSLGRLRERIFGEDYYFSTFKFQDPESVDNYYKYNVSVDGLPLKFYAVYNDKFNNGLFVTHQIGSADNEIVLGSKVLVKRQSISPAVYKYWNEVQSVNPGSTAPANPASNISNGALGYFSVANAKEYAFDFDEFDED